MNRLTARHFLAVVFMVVCVVALGACTAASAPVHTAAPIVEPSGTLLPATETSVPTETPIPPTATSVPTDTPIPPTNTTVPTATSVPPTNTPVPTKTPTRQPTKAATVAPKSTIAPTAPKPAALPLANAITSARNRIESIGGAMDRLYNGSGVAACSPLLADYGGVVNAPEYDVSAQPANVQGAYTLYRQAVALIADKIKFVSDVCTQGGGNVGKLAFDVGRSAIGNAGSMLTNALNQLGQ